MCVRRPAQRDRLMCQRSWYQSHWPGYSRTQLSTLSFSICAVAVTSTLPSALRDLDRRLELQPEAVAGQANAAGGIDLAIELADELGKQRICLHVLREEFRLQALTELLVDEHADAAAAFELPGKGERGAGMRRHEVAHALLAEFEYPVGEIGIVRRPEEHRHVEAEGRAGNRQHLEIAAMGREDDERPWIVPQFQEERDAETSTLPGSARAGSKSKS